MIIEVMKIEDYPQLIALWKKDPGIKLSKADSEKNIRLYLERNPGSSFVVREEGFIAGTIMGGHDGRRGYFHHLYVDEFCRGKGYGRLLFESSMKVLKAEGITRCHLFILPHNLKGQDFWRKMGFKQQGPETVLLFSRDI